jgi:hypothetical protein
MNTKITITANGNIAPNKVIDLGFKYENVGDIITFEIPEEYKKYHHYLVFYMKRKDTILLPVNDLTFKVSTTITRNPGTYEIVFIATESVVVNGDINQARKVFVSNTMIGIVKDNFLQDPAPEDFVDPNLQIIYDKLWDLYDDLATKNEDDYWRGAAYIPEVLEDGTIKWTRTDGKDILIPMPQNIKGPQGVQGPYYVPDVNGEGQLIWKPSQENLPQINNYDIQSMVKEVTTDYVETNFDRKVKPMVDAAVDSKFKWTWNPETKTLFIETEELETIPERAEGVKF